MFSRISITQHYTKVPASQFGMKEDFNDFEQFMVVGAKQAYQSL